MKNFLFLKLLIKARDNNKGNTLIKDKIAIKLAKKKEIKGFINCPINKKLLLRKNVGVTEVLSKKCNVKNNSEVMLIKNKKALPLCGNSLIAFDRVELLSRKNKIIKSKQILLKDIRNLNFIYTKN